MHISLSFLGKLQKTILLWTGSGIRSYFSSIRAKGIVSATFFAVMSNSESGFRGGGGLIRRGAQQGGKAPTGGRRGGSASCAMRSTPNANDHTLTSAAVIGRSAGGGAIPKWCGVTRLRTISEFSKILFCLFILN